jgi:CelD/BcsL family acetyltransferase involved in cellulose biosynthesis
LTAISASRGSAEPLRFPRGNSQAGTVHWLSPDQQGEWDAFVARHPLGLIYHLSSWQRVLESAFGHIRGRFLVVRDAGGEIRAGLPIYGVRSWLLKNRTVSVPFATLCDPLVSTKEDFELLWPVIAEAAGKLRSKRIEIRTRLINTRDLPNGLAPGAKHKHHYLPLGASTDTLFRSFHESCVCRRVKKAKRAGVVIEERQDEQSLRAFHTIMSATRRRLSLPPMPYVFFEAMARRLSPENVSLYLAVHAGQPVGGLLALKFKDLWTGEYSGHSDNAAPGADQLLYWHTIQLAKSSGAARFSFGRTSLDNAGLLEYKRRWATVEEDLTDFVCYPGSAPRPANESGKTVNPVLYATAQLLRFTPAAVQQSFGNFCYRHLG